MSPEPTEQSLAPDVHSVDKRSLPLSNAGETMTRSNRNSDTDRLIKAAQALSRAVDGLKFSRPVTHVYNPLGYAWKPHEVYLRRFGNARQRVVFLGMNPGPFGMAQTGIPFGEIQAVRAWMGIEEKVGQPAQEHPRRPIEGFACKRSEVSGRRLWGLFAERFGSPEIFFADHFVLNYCPLCFMEAGGRNVTPVQLPAAEAAPLFEACDHHLRRALEILQPEWVIGIGGFAAEQARRVTAGSKRKITRILHPSPANPAANRNWAGVVIAELGRLGIWKI